MSLYFYPDPRCNPRPRKTWVPGLANPGSRMMDKVGLGLLYTCIYISSGLRKFRALPNFLRPATVGPDADLHVGAFVEQQLANALSDPVAQHQLVVGFLLAAPAKAGYLYNDVCTQGVQNVLYIYVTFRGCRMAAAYIHTQVYLHVLCL